MSIRYSTHSEFKIFNLESILMKAIVYEKYGGTDVLQLKEIQKPIPKEDEVLIKIRAASVNSWDWDMMKGTPYLFRIVSGGLFKPSHNILGISIAGVIETVGSQVNKLEIGDEVFGDISENYWGGFAEYVCVKEKSLALKSPKMTFEEASAIPHVGVLALQGLRHHNIQKGDQVLINGAGGGVGTLAIQLAKMKGAEVTVVDRADKLDWLKTLGADHIIDYQKENFTKQGKQYDMILDPMAHHSVFDYKRALRPEGTFVMIGGRMSLLLPVLLWGKIFSWFGKKKLKVLAQKLQTEDLDLLTKLFEENKLVPIIDKVYYLEEVPEAIQYLGDGNTRGKLVIVSGS